MLKNLIVLSDGTEIYSGSSSGHNIQSTNITQTVNSGQELTLGSVCASMVEMRIFDPAGTLDIAAGDEFTLYKIDDQNARHKVGIFRMEKPTRPSANIFKIVAYDRVILLDKDLTSWIEALNEWPYTVYDFAKMVAEQCGLALKNTSLLNGDYLIQKFSAQGITGRKLMEWVGQICASFCRAAEDGTLEFSWYKDSEVQLTARNGDGVIGYFQGALSFEDYETATIEKVQIRLTEDDIGVVYPQTAEAVNTYSITGNYLLTTTVETPLQTVAENIYNALSSVRYTPCKVSFPATMSISAGDIITVTDIKDRTIKAYVMSKTNKGQKDEIECTGSPRRDSSTAVNEESFKAVNAKFFEVRKSIDGLRLRAEEIENETNDKFSEVNMNAEGLAATVGVVQQQVEKNQETVNQQIDAVYGKIDDVTGSVNQNAQEIETVKTSITNVQQTAENVNIRVQSILDNGVDKVTTSIGYTFNNDGLKIEREGDDVANLIDNTGMYVTRSGESVFKAGAAGVDATDVTVHNYLIVGDHARFESYPTNRVACFYV